MVDEPLDLDLDALTIGDLEEIEQVMRKPMHQLFPQDGGYTAAGIVGAVYVTMKRKDPSFTLDDARKIKIASVMGAEPDPTNAAG